MTTEEKDSTTTETLEENGAEEATTGIYADIQNLQEMAKDVLVALIRRWPRDMPRPTLLNLYVRADHTHLWHVWATDAFPRIDVSVKGVQHYAMAATKNAADMAIAVDAISDFNHSRVSHVAIISDDSDFISLYAKLAEESVTHRGFEPGDVIPFLWVLTDRRDTKSTLLQEFFPDRYVHIVDPDDAYREIEEYYEPKEDGAGKEPEREEGSDRKPAAEEARPPARPRPSRSELTTTERIALQLIREMPVGKFKSTDCLEIIRSNFGDHPLANVPGPRFGTLFREELLPILEKRGVLEIGGIRPRQYEMTLDAKRSLARF